LHRFDTDRECDRQTDGQTPGRWQRRAKHSAVARKNAQSDRIYVSMGINGLSHVRARQCTNTQSLRVS